MRHLQDGSLAHGRIVNPAYFSPQSGSKILTTSKKNRLRVWDSIFGNLDSPSREIVHSHDFNRHLTAFRAEWDPKDPLESLVVIGRYISENYNRAALHPFDFIDINTGQLIYEVTEPNITTISCVNKLHPGDDDVLASGSSRSIFIWRPKEKSEIVHPKDETKIIVCGRAEKKLNKKFKVKVMILTMTFSQSSVRTPSPENLHQNHPVVVLRASDNLIIGVLATKTVFMHSPEAIVFDRTQLKIYTFSRELFMFHGCLLGSVMLPQYNHCFQFREQFSTERDQLECSPHFLMLHPRPLWRYHTLQCRQFCLV